MKHEKPYRILLYYKYVPIAEHEQFAAEHLDLCRELGLKGRVLVAAEGMNGTVSGTKLQTDLYMDIVRQDPRFHDMVFKIDDAEEHSFKKMFVRARKEIVTFRLEDDVDPNEVTGKYLEPKQFYEELQNDDVIVIDGRNDYEYEIGHFKNAIRPDVKTTKEFPEWIRKHLGEYKDKKILTYCTGGVRCEKLSGLLVKEGFQDVSQLHGGIVTYAKDPEVQGKLFEGKCYVFDERISVPVNEAEQKVVGRCRHCGKPEDRYVNCANPECNLQHICCPECEEIHKRSCSKECEEHELNRYAAGQPVS